MKDSEIALILPLTPFDTVLKYCACKTLFPLAQWVMCVLGKHHHLLQYPFLYREREIFGLFGTAHLQPSASIC